MERIESVAAYVRVSTQEQKLHGLSLDAQKMKLTEYAEENNMRIVGWYVDEGVSGRKLIKNRPELQRMMHDAQKGLFSRIILIKIDRFFRSVAEYHEFMKNIAPVVWTATEEEYDLTTANGRMLVNMKLTIAELEADQTGERIRIVNEYKVQTGQPLVGDNSQPFGFKNATDPKTGRKKIIRDPETEPILRDALHHYITHQSKKKTVVYLHTKHHTSIPYASLTKLFQNTMLCGEYRGNPNYCEAYMTREQFDKLQELLNRNVKCNTESRVYLFTGLIKCPYCGRRLAGNTAVMKRKSGKKYIYKRYRCPNNVANGTCSFSKSVGENTFEQMMLKDIERLFEGVKIEAVEITDSGAVIIPQTSVEDIYVEIDRLNYSWKTGKIRTVEKYEADYAELLEKLEKAEAVQSTVVVKDFSKIEGILHEGWKSVYNNLDDTYKRAFWRSFIQSIELTWETKEKKINDIIFF